MRFPENGESMTSSMDSPRHEAAPQTIFNRQASLERLQEDMTLLLELVELFLAQTPAFLSALGAAIDQHDSRTLARTAHALKGSVCYFGAPVAFDAAARLEENGDSEDVEAARANYPSLEAIFNRLMQELRALQTESA